jgi:hypothetical protein
MMTILSHLLQTNIGALRVEISLPISGEHSGVISSEHMMTIMKKKKRRRRRQNYTKVYRYKVRQNTLQDILIIKKVKVANSVEKL